MVDLTRLIPPNCLGHKCIVGSRIHSLLSYAYSLLSYELLKLDVPSSLRPRYRKDLILALRNATETYPYIEVGIEETLNGVYPPDLVKRIATYAKQVALKMQDYVQAKNRQAKVKVGWRHIISSEPIMITEDYFFFTARLLTDIYGFGRPEIAVCNNNECYPLPLGLYPTTSFISITREAGAIDVALAIHDKYGYMSIYGALKQLDIIEIAVTIQPKKSISRPIFFLLLPNARETAQHLAQFQKEIRELELSLLAKIVKVDDSIIQEELNLREAITRAIREEF